MKWDNEQSVRNTSNIRNLISICSTHSDSFILFILSSVFSDIYSGYLCFFISIIFIGILTAIIGDLASHFGCTVGLKDSVTAVTFVALGTSVPGKLSALVLINLKLENFMWVLKLPR